ncbi:Phosphatidylinositol 3- and 4-kinase family protein [Clavispora lusitaniae]|uniref:1-phosphatidylinositol 4-kinase n=1 Tax=Clavispora lusitaniae (strain ATCC 42720) TaxID=306902 RepID=C4Y9N4_CLAL4|nr:uncharacterized protein CLUG_04924 [Clavispora lusitaniae ATCC 42720]EEQ40796.1 hypothetical protein CLUG_04924 [Clavispora lusitaniae ATCC 42720]KAF7580977.1 Phosphatidylinositol 3- and 4-kinase family protein [Clavispora lusitaniae]
MDQTGEALLKIIDSPDFDVFTCIDYLRRYSSEIGIYYYLTRKLRTYKYDDLEFLIPQLIQLLVSFETNSMALEDFLLEYSEKYPHFSLIVFWNLQAFVFELKDNPNSYSFQIVRNMVNKLQDILFNPFKPSTSNDFRENLHPALVLCGAVAASLGMPQIHDFIKPLIESQAKQQKSFVFKLANFQKTLTKNLTLKNQKLSKESRVAHSDDEKPIVKAKASTEQQRYSESYARSKRVSSQTLTSDESEIYTSDEDEPIFHTVKRQSSRLRSMQSMDNMSFIQNIEEKLDVTSVIKKSQRKEAQQHHLSHSMPDLGATQEVVDVRPSLTPSGSEISLANLNLIRHKTPPSPVVATPVDPHRWLKANYSRNVTKFILALQNISLRLSQLPKEARLSALRAELSIVNKTILPAEIDIPQLLPITSTRNKKYHKILKLSVNEAFVLNSAERVPFLMFVEFLSDEIDFDPTTAENRRLLQSSSGSADKASTLEAESAVDETQDYNDALQQVETDLGELKVATESNSEYNLASLKSSNYVLPSSPLDKKNPSFQSSDNAKTRADQMRIAAVMLQQLESAGKSNSDQSSAIKERIIQSMIEIQDQFESIDYDKINELKGKESNAGERKLENDFKLAEDWKAKKQRIRNSSIYGHLPNWDLCSVIAKNGSDLPQEAFACQLIAMISNIWTKKNIPSWTKRMKILITSANTGLVETITNAISIHSIKKSMTELSISEGDNSRRKIITLKDYFEKLFGGLQTGSFRRAQKNFAKSLASYSIICYVLQIKDRHNGNIMLDNEGHIIHIDFGFLLSNSPGSMGFEAAPFKLTMEYVDLLGGLDSELFLYFKDLCKRCFLALREESDQIVNMVELMQKDSSLPCFNNGENTSVLMKQRLQLQMNEEEAKDFVENVLIGRSLASMYTRLYDQFQLITQGIYT